MNKQAKVALLKVKTNTKASYSKECMILMSRTKMPDSKDTPIKKHNSAIGSAIVYGIFWVRSRATDC